MHTHSDHDHENIEFVINLRLSQAGLKHPNHHLDLTPEALEENLLLQLILHIVFIGQNVNMYQSTPPQLNQDRVCLLSAKIILTEISTTQQRQLN